MTRRSVLVSALLASSLTMGVASAQQVLINAAGATFPYPMYSKWFDEFHKKMANVQINYQSIGSGGGIAQVINGTVDFGATDGPMTEAQMKDFMEKRGSAILHFPTVMGAVVPVYNIPGVTGDINFTGEALAGIFLGTITKWDDPAIAKANPSMKLPSNNIVVVHRSDGSGTSFIFTDYLSKVSKDWETKVGRANSVNWPVGLGGKGNEGVSGSVQQTANSIGYVELIYAVQNKMTYGNVENLDKKFIKASLAGVTAAAAAAAATMPDDFRVSITNAAGKGVYPISSFTWLLIPSKIADPAKKAAIKDFLKWMLGDGQKMTEALAYAQLPKAVVTKELKQLDKIQ
jgi:phosphate transport system substrate-binding protein